jgi:hypothetical protein
MTTYYRPQRDEYGNLFALILTPDAAKPTQSSVNFGDNLSEMKAYMQEHYGEVEMASPAQWQRELESRTYHSPEIIAVLESQSELFGIDASNYIVYGSAMRPMSTSWVRIPDCMCIPVNKRLTGYHSYVIVPEVLDKETIERYELSFVSRPAN